VDKTRSRLTRGRRVAVLVGAVSIVAGAIIFAAGIYHQHWLTTHGKKVQASVVRVIGCNGNGDPEDNDAVMSVALPTAGGHFQQVRLHIDQTICSNYAPDSKVWIYVDPTYPSNVRLTNPTIGNGAWIGILLAFLGLMTLGVAIFSKGNDTLATQAGAIRDSVGKVADIRVQDRADGCTVVLVTTDDREWTLYGPTTREKAERQLSKIRRALMEGNPDTPLERGVPTAR